jgi:hypothetical protein
MHDIPNCDQAIKLHFYRYARRSLVRKSQQIILRRCTAAESGLRSSCPGSRWMSGGAWTKIYDRYEAFLLDARVGIIRKLLLLLLRVRGCLWDFSCAYRRRCRRGRPWLRGSHCCHPTAREQIGPSTFLLRTSECPIIDFQYTVYRKNMNGSHRSDEGVRRRPG